MDALLPAQVGALHVCVQCCMGVGEVRSADLRWLLQLRAVCISCVLCVWAVTKQMLDPVPLPHPACFDPPSTPSFLCSPSPPSPPT